MYVFHCHNLIHEDNMMLDFNVTALPGFGYKEKSRFLDPMDTRFRAQTYHGTNLKTVVQQTLPGFAALEAYTDIDRLEAAIDNYHATATAHLKGAEVTPRP